MPCAFSGTKEGRNDSHRIRALSTRVHLDLSPGTEPLGDLSTLKATFSWLMLVPQGSRPVPPPGPVLTVEDQRSWVPRCSAWHPAAFSH